MRKVPAFIAIFFSLSAYTQEHFPHLDLDLTTAEYRSLLKVEYNSHRKKISMDPSVAYAINLGERLNKWIDLLNSKRRPEDAIRLSSPLTRRNYPISRPNYISPKIIADNTLRNLKDLPYEMAKILMGTEELTDSLKIEDAVFIKAARPLEINYQMAARYRMLIPHKEHFIKAARRDIRGFNFLNENNIGYDDLRDVNAIPDEELPAILAALNSLCLNDLSHHKGFCDEEIKKAANENKLPEFYNAYYMNGQRTWNEFFEINSNSVRRDVEWGSGFMIVPFQTPQFSKVTDFIRTNIQEEYVWGEWGLRINFTSSQDAPSLQFTPGISPHVINGNTIVMDSNQALEEYDAGWTIRHEFGHTLGLPDCYLEFFDVSLNAFVSYQLDVTDLMCSRAGSMNERIFNELSKAYAK